MSTVPVDGPISTPPVDKATTMHVDIPERLLSAPSSPAPVAGLEPALGEISEKGRIESLLRNAPSWLREAVDEFMAASGSDDLLRILCLLLEIEYQQGWKTEGKGLLAMRMRPGLVMTWIGNGRT